MRHFLLTLAIIFLFFTSCQKEEKQPILLADREAPIGWVYLRIYADSTFEFESRGLRDKNIYPGKAEITKDTIFFHYKDPIAYAGTKAVCNKGPVVYTEGKNGVHESLGIKLSKLRK